MMNLYEQYQDPVLELKKIWLIKKAQKLKVFVQANPEIGKIQLDFSPKESNSDLGTGD